MSNWFCEICYSLLQENGSKKRINFFPILLVFNKSAKWKDGIYWKREIRDFETYVSENMWYDKSSKGF